MKEMKEEKIVELEVAEEKGHHHGAHRLGHHVKEAEKTGMPIPTPTPMPETRWPSFQGLKHKFAHLEEENDDKFWSKVDIAHLRDHVRRQRQFPNLWVCK